LLPANLKALFILSATWRAVLAFHCASSTVQSTSGLLNFHLILFLDSNLELQKFKKMKNSFPFSIQNVIGEKLIFHRVETEPGGDKLIVENAFLLTRYASEFDLSDLPNF